jgi:hypothetical protein
MTDDEEVKQRRLAEWRAYLLTLTGDANRLIEALKRQSPEAWQSYRKTVEQEGIIEAEPFNTIHKTAYSLFPGRKTQDMMDLLQRMLDMVREELGKENGGAR